MRLFLIYTVVELAVIVALTSTIGFGWTVLLLTATFVVGLALAGSQIKRHIRRLQSGLTASTVQGAATACRDPRPGQLASRCAVALAADPRRRPSARDRDGGTAGASDCRCHRRRRRRRLGI